MRFLLIFSIFVLVCARDQILPSSFKTIFPYALDKDVEELTWECNLKTSPLLAIYYMMDWMPNHWKAKNATVDPKNRLSNATFADWQATDFLNHRGAIRNFLKYLYRTFVEKKYFKEQQASRMREIFWAADLKSNNSFPSTRALFKNRTSAEFAKTHKDFGAQLENLTSTYYYMYYSSAIKLNWTLSH